MPSRELSYTSACATRCGTFRDGTHRFGKVNWETIRTCLNPAQRSTSIRHMPFITHQLRRSESMVPTRHMTGRCATAGSSNEGDVTMQRCLVSLYSLSNARIGSRRCEVMDPAKTRSNFRLPNAARAHFIDINQLTCDTRLPHPAGKLERPGDVLDGKPLLVSNRLASRLPLLIATHEVPIEEGANVRRSHRSAPPLELERKKAAATPDIQHIHAIHPLRETVVKQHLSDIIVTVDDYSIPQIDGMIPVIFRCLLL